MHAAKRRVLGGGVRGVSQVGAIVAASSHARSDGRRTTPRGEVLL